MNIMNRILLTVLMTFTLHIQATDLKHISDAAKTAHEYHADGEKSKPIYIIVQKNQQTS